MCKKSNQNTDGTSFQNVTFKASVQDLIKVLGEPDYEDNTGNDKTNFEWVMETDDEEVFTIYDWKEYRKLDPTEQIEWHIGSHSRDISGEAQYEVVRELGNYVD
jgi:hypothetical protein